MKAIIWTKYGPPDVLQLQDVPKPVPKDNEVLVKIAASTVGAWDCEARVLKFPLFFGIPLRFYIGLIRPTRIKILGQDLAGEIEAAGKDVKNYKVGDQIYATTGMGFGGHAEYICLPANPTEMGGALALKPANMTYPEAAAVPVAGLEALHFTRLARIRSGQSILINGSGGSIGTFALQLAKYYGGEVTAVDSTAKLDMLRSIGADHVVDYTQEDFSKSGNTYDVIIDVVGKASYSGCVRSLKPNGRFLLANPKLSHLLQKPWTNIRSDKRVISGAGEQNSEDLLFLKDLIEAGKLKSVIDRSYPLAETADGHRYVESGAKQGSVIINVAQE